MGTLRTMADVIDANRASGQHWFSEGAMQFFNSKIETELILGRYFVTSEHPDGSEPRYTVRAVAGNGYVTTVGEFMAHATLAEARAAIGRRQQADHEHVESYLRSMTR